MVSGRNRKVPKLEECELKSDAKDVLYVEIGGLGIHITKELMDKVSYERKQGRNRLTIKKRIPANEITELNYEI